MRITKGSVKTIKEKIEIVSNLLYQQNLNEAFSELMVLINELSQLYTYLFNQENADILSNLDQNQLLSILNEAMNALEKRDDVLLADVLNYDLTDFLNELEKKL